jgi:hypothetical protein
MGVVDELDEQVEIDDNTNLLIRPDVAMSTKKSVQRKDDTPRRGAWSKFGTSRQTVAHNTVHGVRIAPKAKTRSSTAGAPRADVGTVEVRVDPKTGSAAWRELVSLSIAAAAGRVSSIPETQRFKVLASVKKRLKPRGLDTRSSERLFAALHKAGLFEEPSNQAVADRGEIEPTDRGGDFDIPAANRAALERAFVRAETNKADILKQSDMLRGEQLAERLGVARATVDNQRGAGRLLALEFGTKRGVRYPAWQSELVEDARTRVAFESVLGALAKVGPWSRYRFFVQPAPALGGRTPIDALKAGEHESVRDAAETWARGDQGGH